MRWRGLAAKIGRLAAKSTKRSGARGELSALAKALDFSSKWNLLG